MPLAHEDSLAKLKPPLETATWFENPALRIGEAKSSRPLPAAPFLIFL
jgi:hypothetical protein